jgi:excisionase family DNA binding protein
VPHTSCVFDRLRVYMRESWDQLSFDFAEARQGETRDRTANHRLRQPASPRPRRQNVTRRDKADESDRRLSDRRTPASLADGGSLLTTTEAARLLHVHPRTVQRLVRSGALSAVHIGRAVRFDSRDLLALTDRLRGDVSASIVRRALTEPAPAGARRRTSRRTKVRR